MNPPPLPRTNLESCPDCGQLRSKRAEKCPHCGVKIARTSGCAVFAGGFLVLGMVISLGVALTGQQEQTSAPPAGASPSPSAARRAAEDAAKAAAAKAIEDAIDRHQVQIGMTAEQARRSWGSPRNINRTTTDSHQREQWVYESSYLYFVDGILRTIQTRE